MYQDSIQYEIVNTDIFWRRIVNIPCSSNLKNEEIDRVISVFRSMIKEQDMFEEGIIILGGGGHSASVISILRRINDSINIAIVAKEKNC